MKQGQYNYFPEPDRERKLLLHNVIIPISYSSLYDSLEKQNPIFNCLYCNIAAEKKTKKNYMQTFQGVF